MFFFQVKSIPYHQYTNVQIHQPNQIEGQSNNLMSVQKNVEDLWLFMMLL